MKIFSIFLTVASSVILSPTLVDAQNVNMEWLSVYTNGHHDIARSVAVDTNRNIYVTGYSTGTLADFFTIKYNSNGTALWTKRFNGTANGNDEGKQIAIDGLGNIYVTGFSAVTGTGASDYTTIKYNSNGDQLWVRNYNGPANSVDAAVSIAFDASGNIYVTGYSTGIGTGNDFATLKYNPAGSLQWSRRYNGPGNGNDQAKAITVDDSGNIYVTGFSAGVGTGSSDYATIKYNSAGDSLWVKRYNGTSNSVDIANALDADLSGNVYVTGYSAGAGTGTFDYATIKYNSSGDSLWVKRYNGPGNGEDVAYSLEVDNSGNIFVTGYSAGIGTGNDYATIKYNTNGDSLWVRRFNNGTEYCYFLKLDAFSNVYVTGSSNGAFRTIKYDTFGNLIWNEVINISNGTDQGNCIAVDGLGNVYVAGLYADDLSGSYYSYFTCRYSEPFIKILIEGFYETASNKMIRDTVRIYLRSASPPYSIIDSAKSFLDTSGNGIIKNIFLNAPGGQYYIVVKHRNSIETWSNQSISFPTYDYDFTTGANQAFGNNQVLKGSKYCMYSGDVNQDGFVDVVDMSISDNAAFNGLSGYIQPDVNGDLFVDLSDLTVVDNNAFDFRAVVRP